MYTHRCVRYVCGVRHKPIYAGHRPLLSKKLINTKSPLTDGIVHPNAVATSASAITAMLLVSTEPSYPAGLLCLPLQLFWR